MCASVNVLCKRRDQEIEALNNRLEENSDLKSHTSLSHGRATLLYSYSTHISLFYNLHDDQRTDLHAIDKSHY
jgi:hypothetical protein